ncbi:hypothetical protein AKJ09_00736 [Labilithrix luteola]|uniref:FHA domain-containing protein n=1 Tax=Labilithrix luteola TaxID=1391654 RepID=A0A0K1PKM7_9BACT|nr:hypothetical protein [Labilithrix luteola]AKU94072.1 hypothetical protein AKJ09_00736 [Labilithrix luteola]
MRFKIRHGDGRFEELVVESEQVIIGSGAHCEIRLPPEQARVEHVIVRASAAGIRAIARSLDPAPTLNGVDFVDAPILDGSVLRVGAVELEVAGLVLSAGPEQAKNNPNAPRPFVLVFALAGLAACAMMILGQRSSGGVTAEPKVPDLWTAGEATCPEGGAQAQALARTKLAAADGKRERAPFHVQDGVAAVPLYQVAVACFRASGDEPTANEIASDGQKLKREVALEFRIHRVRLQHAFTVKDWKTAQREVKVLLAYTEGLKAEYVTWLSNWDRKLELEYGKKKS